MIPFCVVLFFINSASVSLAIEKAANLHVVLKYSRIKHVVLDRNLADFVFHRSVCSVKLVGVGELCDALYRPVKRGQQIPGGFGRVQRVGK